MPTSRWTREHVAAISDTAAVQTPVIPDGGLPRLVPGRDYWDLCAVLDPDGGLADLCGREVWAGLSAAATGHPEDRHARARIRLVARRAGGAAGWEDLGPIFPDGASAGSREWAGTFTFDAADGSMTALYTAAGVRGETTPTWAQRIFSARATVTCSGAAPTFRAWGEHTEVVVADGVRYTVADAVEGRPGFIKAFRDPFPVTDESTGQAYLLLAASLEGAETDFNGCVGIALQTANGYELLDPLVTADGVNNELERPHVVRHEGRYLLFFSTQERTFHPDCWGPTGLYGMVADNLLGPYEPLNGSGLVLRNPEAEPVQAYSWTVLPDLTTRGFVDYFALHGRDPEQVKESVADVARPHFGGTLTPASQIHVEGMRTWLTPVERD